MEDNADRVGRRSLWPSVADVSLKENKSKTKKNKFKSCTVELRTLKSRKERADCDKSALARVATPYKGALLRLNPAPLVRTGVTFTLAVISSSSGGANKQKKKRENNSLFFYYAASGTDQVRCILNGHFIRCPCRWNFLFSFFWFLANYISYFFIIIIFFQLLTCRSVQSSFVFKLYT